MREERRRVRGVRKPQKGKMVVCNSIGTTKLELFIWPGKNAKDFWTPVFSRSIK